MSEKLNLTPIVELPDDQKEERKRWLANREEAGRLIDPETAEVHVSYGQIMDPYGVFPDLPREYDCVGRIYFARSPGSDVWVSFYDMPEATVDALWEKLRSKKGRANDEIPF